MTEGNSQPLPPSEITSPTGETFHQSDLLDSRPDTSNILSAAEQGLQGNGFPDVAVDMLANLPAEERGGESQPIKPDDEFEGHFKQDKSVIDPETGERVATTEKPGNTQPSTIQELGESLRRDGRFTALQTKLTDEGKPSNDEAVLKAMRERYPDVADQFQQVEQAEQAQLETKEKENNEKREGRILDNANASLSRRTDEALKKDHGDYAKSEDGVPIDPVLLAEYARHRKNIETGHNEDIRKDAMIATAVQEYETKYPRPDAERQPAEFGQWVAGLSQELDDLEEGLKSKEGGGKKATKPEANSQDDQKGNEYQEAEHSDVSWGNARKLAKDWFDADGKKQKVIEDKVKEITANAPQLQPRFETRFRLMKIEYIAENLLLMAAMGGAMTMAHKTERAASQSQ